MQLEFAGFDLRKIQDSLMMPRSPQRYCGRRQVAALFTGQSVPRASTDAANPKPDCYANPLRTNDVMRRNAAE